MDKLLRNNISNLPTMNDGFYNEETSKNLTRVTEGNVPHYKPLSLHFHRLNNPNYGEIYLSPLYVELLLAKCIDQISVEFVEEDLWGLSVKSKPTFSPFLSFSSLFQWCIYMVSGDRTALFPICFTSAQPYLLTTSHHLYLANYESPYNEKNEETSSNDFNFDSSNLAIINTLLSDIMEPLLSYLIWCDKKIYSLFTKPAYLNSFNFGLNSIYLRQHQVAIMNYLKSEGLFNRRQFIEKLSLLLSNINESMSQHFSEVIDGKEKLNKLGQRIFAYLSVMFSLPLPDDFKTTCNMFPKLKIFCSFINNKYSIWKDKDNFLSGLENRAIQSKNPDFDVDTPASLYRFTAISFGAIVLYLLMKNSK